MYDVWSECKCHRKQRRKSRGPVRKKTCFICEKKAHFAGDPCPAKVRKCAKSLKYGHFASCCKGNHFPLESGKYSQQKRASNGKKRAGRQTNQMGGYSEYDEHVSCEESICICCSGGSSSRRCVWFRF